MIEETLGKLIKAKFDKEWDGTSNIPYLENLKPVGVTMNVKYLLPLESNTPYGNLQLSWFSIIARIERINNLIDTMNLDFDAFMNWTTNQDPISQIQGQNLPSQQLLNAELFVYLLKTLADRIVMLLSLVNARHNTGKYPTKIDIDSLGAFLALGPEKFCEGCLEQYVPMLSDLNDVANSFKHSFLNLQLSNVHATNAPGIISIYQPHNKSEKNGTVHYLIFTNLAREFDEFLLASKNYLSEKSPNL